MNHSALALVNEGEGAPSEALRHQRLERLRAELALRCPTCRLRLNRNGKTMLSLRGRQGASVVSVHVGLLDHPEALADLPMWILANGRRTSPRLKEALQNVWREHRRLTVVDQRVQLPALELMPTSFDLVTLFEQVHCTWFAQLSKPTIRWARNGPRRTLTSIRFGCYRARPHPLITINPRIARPGVPRVFVEHVLFHELCHHAQACAPIRGEPPHSRRFRTWEAQYPHHELALTWERLHLERFLAE